MYLYLGQGVMMPQEDIVGIFDLDNTTWSHRTRKLLDRAEEEGRVIFVGEDLPRSFIVCETEVCPVPSSCVRRRRGRKWCFSPSSAPPPWPSGRHRAHGP